MHVTAIIAAGGSGRRLGGRCRSSCWSSAAARCCSARVEAFSSHPDVSDVIVAVPAEVLAAPPSWLDGASGVRLVAGGERRQDSVANAFAAVAAECRHRAGARRGAAVCDRRGDLARDPRARARTARRSSRCRSSDTVKRVAGRGDRRDAAARGDFSGADAAGVPPRGARRPRLTLGRTSVAATDEAMLAERAGTACTSSAATRRT